MQKHPYQLRNFVSIATSFAAIKKIVSHVGNFLGQSNVSCIKILKKVFGISSPHFLHMTVFGSGFVFCFFFIQIFYFT